jgi:pyrroloquinoline quinone biosynthesis protein B
MKIRVLGSAAGGAFPQWNCHCRNCSGVRDGTLSATRRTQSSIAISGELSPGWALVNVSPDIAAQLEANPVLRGAGVERGTAITGIVLVDGQIDHTTGLYMLREAPRPWRVWCTDRVFTDLTTGHPVFQVLDHYCGVERRRIGLDGEAFEIDGVPDVRWRAVPVASKPGPYSPNRETPAAGDNVALAVSDRAGRSALYAPGLGAVDDTIWQAMRSADCVLVDGTFWTDDEMIVQGLGRKRARDMGHLAQSGPGGMLEWLAELPSTTRKILIHINNSNPVLDERSSQRAELERLGIELAFDGMEIAL